MNKETNDRVTSKSPHRTLPPHTPVSHKVVPGSTLGAQSSFLTLLLRVSRTQRPPIHERTHKSTPFRAKRVRSWRVLRRSAPSQPRWGRRGSSFFSLTMAFRRGVGASQTDRDSERWRKRRGRTQGRGRERRREGDRKIDAQSDGQICRGSAVRRKKREECLNENYIRNSSDSKSECCGHVRVSD